MVLKTKNDIVLQNSANFHFRPFWAPLGEKTTLQVGFLISWQCGLVVRGSSERHVGLIPSSIASLLCDFRKVTFHYFVES